jgi:phage terminase Nu1 subunit (DNA packaging protein)
MKPLTLNAYARHRRAKRLPGGSIRSVVEAVAAGRIDVGPGQTIADAEAADRAWEARTDHAKRPPSTNGHAWPGTLPEARRLESLERARGLKLANDKLAGSLVEARAVERMFSTMLVTCKTRLRGIPSRAKQRFPDLTAAHLEGLAALIDECLVELADGAAEPQVPGGRIG